MKWLLIQISLNQWFGGRHKQKETINLKITGAEKKGQNSVTLLGVKIDN